MSYNDWFDKVGLIHLDRLPDVTNSENGPLFSAEFYLLYKLTRTENNIHPMIYKSITSVNPNPKIYKPSALGGEHFSHDNMTGLYTMYYLAFKRCPKHLDIWTKYVRHPRDLCFFSYAKLAHKEGMLWNILHHLLLIIPALAMVISCFQRFKVRNGKKIIKTDGKLLTFVRCYAFNLTKTKKVCEFILKKRGWTSWHHIFSTYFLRQDHPNNQMSQLLRRF